MAAASSGNVPVVERGVEEGGQTELVVDRQGERLGLEKGQPPQEDTKQHMNVVEVSVCFDALGKGRGT